MKNKLHIDKDFGWFIGSFDNNQKHKHYAIQLSIPLENSMSIKTSAKTINTEFPVLIQSNVVHQIVSGVRHFLLLINPASTIGHFWSKSSYYEIQEFNFAPAVDLKKILTYGQCNTKANLFMALLRAVGVPNRLHGFTIHKALQKGAITGLWYILSPKYILHSWVEVYLDGEWYNLEGLILDKPYLNALQNKFSDCKTTFCGYGVYTDNFKKPQIDWERNHTYIQGKGINQDFGLFDTPDEFYSKHQQKLGPFKKWIYRNCVRHLMIRNVNRIRKNGG